MDDRKISEIISQPIFFERNRVFRVYRGGKLFADFFGDQAEDSFFPEEWIASAVKALNLNPQNENEGLSVIKGTTILFSEVLKKFPQELLGSSQEFDILVKILDSAIRLPVQAHPDRQFSRQYFQSDHGKIEMWLILATRENAKIYFGFQEGVTKEEFIAAVQKSESDRGAMEKMLNVLDVKPGDVFLIPARVVHAIGYGCQILEVQEPTDFTIQPEAWCGDYRLSDYERYLGLKPDTALECFDFENLVGPKAIAVGKKTQVPFIKEASLTAEHLITYDDTPAFAVNRYKIETTDFMLKNAPAVYIVTAGQGKITHRNFSSPINKGDNFFLPVAANGSIVSSQSKLEIVECLPSLNIGR
jgi:mannose-6-phosphate isomerase